MAANPAEAGGAHLRWYQRGGLTELRRICTGAADLSHRSPQGLAESPFSSMQGTSAAVSPGSCP